MDLRATLGRLADKVGRYMPTYNGFDQIALPMTAPMADPDPNRLSASSGPAHPGALTAADDVG